MEDNKLAIRNYAPTVHAYYVQFKPLCRTHVYGFSFDIELQIQNSKNPRTIFLNHVTSLVLAASHIAYFSTKLKRLPSLSIHELELATLHRKANCKSELE